MPDVAATIKSELQDALEADELELPTLPEVALRIRDEAESDSVSAASLAQVIGADARTCRQPDSHRQLRNVPRHPHHRRIACRN